MKSVTQKTMAQILNETCNAYTKQTRATKGARCLYLAPNGCMCAVGRCLIDPRDLSNMPVESIPDLSEALKPEYRGHSLEFWMELQSLHDHGPNWSETGLSEKGLKEARMIADSYNIDPTQIDALTQAS